MSRARAFALTFVPARSALVVVALAMGGCASGKTAPSSPPSTYEGAPAADSPSGAQPPAAEDEFRLSEREDEDPSVALDRAESELDRILGEARAYATPPPAPPPTAGGDDGSPPPKRPEVAQGGDPCHAACRALASMRRATERLCALSGEDETRCGDARVRVERAEQRVQTRCPACIE